VRYCDEESKVAENKSLYIHLYTNKGSEEHVVIEVCFESHNTPLRSEFCRGGGRKTGKTCSDAPRTFGAHTHRKSRIMFFEEEKYCEVAIFISLLLYKQRLQGTCCFRITLFESKSAEFMMTLTVKLEERYGQGRKEHSILECLFGAHTHQHVRWWFLENRKW
jgi:hypothetical protein